MLAKHTKKAPRISSKCLFLLTWARRFELPTFWSVAKRSIQLSYAHIMPQTGIEPVREYKSRRILSPVRLPVPPRRHVHCTTSLLCKLNGWRWIRTTEAICSRFTVCPLWPLGNPSIARRCLDNDYLYHILI